MAELFIHHTDVPSVTQAPRGGTASNLANIQRYNFATAFTLAHGPTLGEALRAREDRYRAIPFLRFDWLGKRWVTGLGLDFLDPFFLGDWWKRESLDWRLREPISPIELLRSLPQRVFAIEETRRGSHCSGFSEAMKWVPWRRPSWSQWRTVYDIRQGAAKMVGSREPSSLTVLRLSSCSRFKLGLSECSGTRTGQTFVEFREDLLSAKPAPVTPAGIRLGSQPCESRRSATSGL